MAVAWVFGSGFVIASARNMRMDRSAFGSFVVQSLSVVRDSFGLYGQVTKRTWWMPRQLEAMKDVVACDKSRGAGKQALIREFPNGETRPADGGHHILNP